MALFENLPDATVVLDRSGKLLEANRAMSDLAGYSLGELLEMTAEQFFDPFDLEIRPLRLTGSEPQTRPVSLRALRRKDGSSIPVDVRVTRLGDGLVIASVRGGGCHYPRRPAYGA